MAYGLGMKGNSGQNGLNFQVIVQGGEVVSELQVVSLQVVKEIFITAMFCLQAVEGCLNRIVRNYYPAGCLRQKDLFLQGNLVAGLQVCLCILFHCQLHDLFFKDLQGKLHERKGQSRFNLSGDSGLHGDLFLLVWI